MDIKIYEPLDLQKKMMEELIEEGAKIEVERYLNTPGEDNPVILD